MLPQELLIVILQTLVNNPSDVSVERSVDDMGVLLRVKLNKSDAGLVIGRSGQTASSIRYLIRIIGLKNKEKISVKIET